MMKSPRGKASNMLSPPKGAESKVSVQGQGQPRRRRLSGFNIKTEEGLKSNLSSNRSSSPFQKHQKSFNSLYSKYMQKKNYEERHELGYSADQIKRSVNFIFQKYDSNGDNLLDRQEVKRLIEKSLLHMGQKHVPSEQEIVEFIYLMDKNNDGKLSRDELENAFKRVNRIQY